MPDLDLDALDRELAEGMGHAGGRKPTGATGTPYAGDRPFSPTRSDADSAEMWRWAVERFGITEETMFYLDDAGSVNFVAKRLRDLEDQGVWIRGASRPEIARALAVRELMKGER